MSVIHITEKNFDEEVLKSPVPVLVDFWAEWCGPCRMLTPIIEELGAELSEKMKVAKVNVDEAQELAASFNVMSIPTIMIFKEGKVVGQMVGAMPKETLLGKLKPYIA